MQARHAPNTTINYGSSWRSFSKWCAEARCSSLPAKPETVIDFILWCLNEDLKLSSITARVNAIVHYHREAGFPSPKDDSVREIMSLARRDRKEKAKGRVPLTPEQLRKILKCHSTSDYFEIRDAAMLLVGFSAGWRRSEVVALDLADVEFVPQGMTLFQASSKMDQVGKGRLVGIDRGRRWPRTCPVRALQAWLDIRGHWPGPLFTRIRPSGAITEHRLTDEALYKIVKNGLRRIGVDPKDYGAHSLRSGFVTCAAENGANEVAIGMRTGQSLATIARYIRPVKIFASNPLRRVL